MQWHWLWLWFSTVFHTAHYNDVWGDPDQTLILSGALHKLGNENNSQIMELITQHDVKPGHKPGFISATESLSSCKYLHTKLPVCILLVFFSTSGCCSAQVQLVPLYPGTPQLCATHSLSNRHSSSTLQENSMQIAMLFPKRSRPLAVNSYKSILAFSHTALWYPTYLATPSRPAPHPPRPTFKQHGNFIWVQDRLWGSDQLVDLLSPWKVLQSFLAAASLAHQSCVSVSFECNEAVLKQQLHLENE